MYIHAYTTEYRGVYLYPSAHAYTKIAAHMRTVHLGELVQHGTWMYKNSSKHECMTNAVHTNVLELQCSQIYLFCAPS